MRRLLAVRPRSWLTLALTLAVPLGALAQDRVAVAPGAWPMPGHDPRHSAWAPGTGHLDATPSERWSFYVGGDVGSAASLVADVNNDGVDEVIAIVGGKVVARSLQDAVVWDSPPLGLTSIVAYTDLDGDAHPELVAVRSNPAGVFVLSGSTGDLIWQRHDFDDATQGVSRGISLGITNARVVPLAPGATDRQPAVVMRVGGGDGNVHAFTFARGSATPTDAWNFLGPARGWWMQHIGLGDFDGDGRTDVATYLNGQTVRLLSGSTDPMRRGAPFMGTDFVSNDGGQSLARTRSVRLPGATNDSFFFFTPSAFGRLDAAAPATSRTLAFRKRNTAGNGAGDINLSTVSTPSDPVLIAGSRAYLVVNVFDDHDCEQNTPNAGATCSDLDGINDPAATHQWHMAVFDANTLSLVTQVSGQIAVALVDLDGDGTPEILSQAAGSDYRTRPVSSVTAWWLGSPDAGAPSLNVVWEVPNAGLAGLLQRDEPRLSPGDGTPLIITSGTSRYLLLYQGDSSSTSLGVPVGLQFVDLVTGRFYSRTLFSAHVSGRPVGLARSSTEVTAPDTLVVSENDGFFHLFTRDFLPPRNVAATLGLVHSGGYISPLAAAHLTGSNARLADLVTNRSDGSLNVVPVSDATPDHAPTATVQYYGGMFQTPVVIASEDTPSRPQVIVGNRLGTLPYIAALSPLSPAEVWASDPIPLAANGTFMKFPPAIGDANNDGIADIFVNYDAVLTGGIQTCCGSAFYNVVSGRGGGTAGRHPLLWSNPYSPDAVGHGTCCWQNGAAAADMDGDGRDDLVVAANSALVVRTGADVAADRQIIYYGDSFPVASPSGSGTTFPANYGTPLIARFDLRATLSAFLGVGREGGWAAGVFNLRMTTPLAHTRSAGEWAIPEFSEGTSREGAAASYATTADHGASAVVGLGFGTMYGNFYALEPGARPDGSETIPVRWARCLHDGIADAEVGPAIGTCPAGQALSDTAAADIDGDGRDEFLVGSDDGYLYALHASDGSLAFSYNLHASVGSPIVADVDGDGSLGVMVSLGDGYVHALGASNTTNVIGMPHTTAVTVTAGVASTPTPDVRVMRSESLRFIAAAWTDTSTARDSTYRARVSTAFGSPVVPWTPVMHTAGASQVVWIAEGSYVLNGRYVVEIAGQPARSSRADVSSTNVIQIVDETPPTVAPVMVSVTRGPRVARFRSTLTDATQLASATVTVRDAAGMTRFAQTLSATGESYPVDVTWGPDSEDAGVIMGDLTVTVTAQDVGGHSASQMATFTFDEPADAGMVDASMTDATPADATTDTTPADAMTADASDASDDATQPLDVATDASNDVTSETPATDAGDESVTDVAMTDTGTAADAAPTGTSDSSGCGCNAPGRGDSSGSASATFALLALGLVTRRRRSAR